MHKIRLIIITVILIATVGIAPIYADMITEGPIISDDIVSYSTISNALKEELKNAGEDDLIPVAIELKDDIDYEEVDRLALNRAELSTEEATLMSADISGLSDNEYEVQWQRQMDSLRKVSRERIDILVDHYTDMNDAFIKSIGIEEERIGYVGSLTSFIREVMLTPAEIREISTMEEVLYMDYDPSYELEDMASINNTYQIINGDVAVNGGYTGNGVRVGVVEEGHPITSQMGSDAVNIIITDTYPFCTPHATMVCGIIKKMAPNCTIYTKEAYESDDLVTACEYLIKNYDVDVINLSCGASLNGQYDANSRNLDKLVKSLKVPIAVATGKVLSGESATTKYVNQLALAPNVIAVGGVNTTGTEQSASGAYTLGSYSLYREVITGINRPDICAPGNVQIYSYSDEGTSLATPHITGTIVQMISRNSGLKGNVEAIKATLMASASYNAGTSMAYTGGGNVSNYEGAGVVDSGFCYSVAANSRYTQTVLSSSTTYFYEDITCSSTSVPLRIACAWDVSTENTSTYVTDYDIRVYKDGVFVTSALSYSNSTTKGNTNYEVLEIPTATLRQYGTGTYQIKVMRSGNFIGNTLIKMGLAWGQR